MFLADQKVIEKLTSPQFPIVRIGNYNFSDMRVLQLQLGINVSPRLQATGPCFINEFSLDRRAM